MSEKKGIDLIITGLPRSGTSFLCARVNDFQNTVVINEPSEVFESVKGGSVEGLQKIFAQYRNNIAQGKPVYNKIKDGKYIEDTRLEDSRSLHHHPVENEQFMLGIKNTLIFLAMLPEIVESKAFPKIIATVRHPFDCIGSWHNVEFPHIKHAKPAFLQNYSGREFSAELSDLLHEEELIVRSAKLWVLLAKTLWRLRGKILILRYEDMVSKPENAYQEIGKYLGLSCNIDSLPRASRPVRRRDGLNDEQKAVISPICGKVATQYAYRMR